MKARYFNFSSFLLLVTLMVFSACKKEFDEPPIATLPNLEANATIADIVAMAAVSPVALGNQVLEATVIADDRSGNFYKQIVIQDSTGGIRIDVDAFSLYNEYPIGRKVWIKCEGLYVWKDGDVPALIGSDNTDNSRIPQSTYRQFIIGGEYNQPVTPTVKTLLTLTPADFYTLVQLDNVEFENCYAGSNYAFASTQQSKNVDLHDCASSLNIIVRNSGFADFANELMPTGNGSIVAVYNSFSNTKQLLIRDPQDVSSMTGTRCNPIAAITNISIAALRAQYTGSPVTASGKIKGVVISDNASGQWQSRNMVIQEPNGEGITVRFDDDHNFATGDYVEIKASGGTLEEFNGLLQLNNVAASCATALPAAGAPTITPRLVTVADILANGNAWESTLIKVQGASLNGGLTYGDFGVLLNDNTGSVTLFSAFSNFASVALPTGTGEVTGVIGDYNGLQVYIRNLTDVNITGSGTGGGTNLNQMSIQDVRNLFMGAPVNAPATTKIVGIVISDRNGGNWQDQNMVIQEPNGAGITIRFAGSHTFDVGEEVEVNISGQTIEEFNGLLQINGVPNNNATSLSTGNSITPRVATVQDITTNADAWESTLVNVQTASITSPNGTYGDFNTTLDDATGSISMFSAFSNFSGSAVPTGTGDVTGVVGDFNGVQINIRGTYDVNISGGSGGGGGNLTYMTIANVRALFTGSNATVPANTGIRGIVISDKDNENITGRNVVIQETGGAGIVIRFDATNSTMSLGDSVTVNISGGTVSEFNGLMQVEGVANGNATVVSSNNSITPRVATVQDVLNNAEQWESTLVVINGATITGGSTYAGALTVGDGSGTVDMYTRSAATFSGSAVPSGNVNITAIVSQFNNYQIIIRNTSDVQ